MTSTMMQFPSLLLVLSLASPVAVAAQKLGTGPDWLSGASTFGFVFSMTLIFIFSLTCVWVCLFKCKGSKQEA